MKGGKALDADEAPVIFNDGVASSQRRGSCTATPTSAAASRLS